MSDDWTTTEIVGAVISCINSACYVISFPLISFFVGSADYWQNIYDQRERIWIMSMMGSVTLFAAGAIYFFANPNHEKIMYFIFTVTFLSLGLAFSALGVALIHRKK